MRKPKTAEEAYESCLADGYINEIREINKDKVKSLMDNAQTNINSAQIIMKWN